ncbi:hypothetical protein [Neobacillus niacini]|uniref:hypothetical protein n=1 Tax=Neobacillus niacini TaxID=86668 RepID=UPI0021CB9291|nr:hypothetical protein [Neobacillus niacini]MCM3763751.1 hypothetical protein [Neobacillus niacini]
MTFVLGTQEIKSRLFAEKQPMATSDMAFVYTNANGDMIPVKSGQRLSRMEVKSEKLTKMYRVELTPKMFEFQKEFASAEVVETFIINATVQVKVDDPVLIIRNGDHNYKQLIDKQLYFEVADLAKKYDINQYQGLKFDIEGLRNDARFTHSMESIGLKLLDVKATVELSAKSKAHLEKLKQLEKDTAYKHAEIESNKGTKIKESQSKNQVQNVEMDNLQQLLEMYGPDGARIAYASSDQERMVIIQEIQEKRDREQRARQETINGYLKDGLTPEEIEKILKLTSQSSAPVNPLLTSAPQSQPVAHLQQPQEQKEEDPLLAELNKVLEKGE